MATESTFLRISCKDIDPGRFAIALMNLRNCGFLFFNYEPKIKDVIKNETTKTKSKIYGCRYS